MFDYRSFWNNLPAGRQVLVALTALAVFATVSVQWVTAQQQAAHSTPTQSIADLTSSPTGVAKVDDNREALHRVYNRLLHGPVALETYMGARAALERVDTPIVQDCVRLHLLDADAAFNRGVAHTFDTTGHPEGVYVTAETSSPGGLGLLSSAPRKLTRSDTVVNSLVGLYYSCLT